MAKYWDPSNDEFNPYNEDSPANPKSQEATDSQDNSSSTDLLRNSENSALSKTGPSFRYSGKGKSANQGKGKNQFSGRKKGITALILSLCIIGGGAAFLGSSNSLLAPTMNYLFTEGSDYQTIDTSHRIPHIFGFATSGKGAGNDATKVYSQLPNKTKTAISNTDIEVNGNSLSIDGQTIDGDNFVTKYNNDANFRQTIENDVTFGRAGNFYDDAAYDTYNSQGISRNLYDNYEQTSNAEVDAKNFSDTMDTQFDNKSNAEIISTREETVEKEDEDGNKYFDSETQENHSGVATTNKNNTTDSVAMAQSYVQNLSQKVGKVVNWGCTALRLGSSVAVTLSAVEMYQSIKYYMGLMENPSKMIYGEGSNSAINAFLNEITTPYTTTTTNLADAHVSGNAAGQLAQYNSDEYQGDGGELIELGDDITQTGAAIEDPNMIAFLNKGSPSKNSGRYYSIEQSSVALLSSLASLGVTNSSCAKLQAGVAGVELAATAVTTLVQLIPGAGTVSVTSAMVFNGIKTLFGQFWSRFGISLAINVGVTSFLGFLIPTLAKHLFTNIFDDLHGIPAGATLAKGALATGSKNGQSNSGMGLTDSEGAIAYSRLNQETIAMEAETDRLNRSPFDLSSKNTFLGSIAHSILPSTIGGTTNGVTRAASMLSTTSNALASLTNSAIADGEGTTFMNTYGDCPNLESIGAVGDVFCNPIVITDPALLDLSPDDDTYVKIIQDQLECNSDGSCSVKSNTNLARYITSCVDRTSPFGVIDSNIQNALEMGNVVVNALPVVGNVVDIINGISSEENENWSKGVYCGKTSSNTKWDEIKYYQRYVADMRILDQMGAFEGSKNPVTGYREKIRNENPVEDTLAGYISKITGNSIEDSQLILDTIAYYEFLNNYNPEERIAMNQDNSNKQPSEAALNQIKSEKIYIKHHTQPETIIAYTQYIIYADIRNRSYTV